MRVAVVVGSGTGVGKTTFVAAWARARAAQGRTLCGWKPIESGGDADARALLEVSSPPPPPTLVLPEPLSPHLAARRARVPVSLERLVEQAKTATEGDLVIETAGGLFTQLDDRERTNAELVGLLVSRFKGLRVILVAPNRLGVLHDVEACRRGATVSGLILDMVVLAQVAAPTDDLSRTLNAAELSRSLPTVTFDQAGPFPLEEVERRLRFT